MAVNDGKICERISNSSDSQVLDEVILFNQETCREDTSSKQHINSKSDKRYFASDRNLNNLKTDDSANCQQNNEETQEISKKYFKDTYKTLQPKSKETKQNRKSHIQTPKRKDYGSISKHDNIMKVCKKTPTNIQEVIDISSSDNDDCILEKVVAPSKTSSVSTKVVNQQTTPINGVNQSACDDSSDSSSDDATLAPKETSNVKLHYRVATLSPKKKHVTSNDCGLNASNIVYSHSRKHNPSCITFTLEMSMFYDKDVPGVFNEKDILSRQTDNRSMWKINSDDMYQRRFRQYNRGMRCTRCKEFDHFVRNCPREPHCRYCGESDHINIRKCPGNCCLKCGGRPHMDCWRTGPETFCDACKTYGHETHLCPDSWRRFHLTTTGDTPILSNLSQSSKVYCSNCAAKGHYGYQCRLKRINKAYIEPTRNIIGYKSATGGKRKNVETSKQSTKLKKLCENINTDEITDDSISSCVTLFNNGFLDNDLDDRRSMSLQSGSKNRQKMRRMINDKNQSLRHLTNIMKEAIDTKEVNLSNKLMNLWDATGKHASTSMSSEHTKQESRRKRTKSQRRKRRK